MNAPASNHLPARPAREASPRLSGWAQWAAGTTAALLHRCLGTRHPERLTIFVYHRICHAPRDVTPPSLNVTPERFRRQLAGLLDRGVTFWPLRRVLECRQRGAALPPATAVLTFDDGFANLATTAAPILQELQVPATVFVATAYVDDAAPFPFDAWGRRHCGAVPAECYRPLAAAECQRLLDGGLVEIGSHTHSHAHFGGRVAAFADDLRRSLETLARWGLQRVPFAFPGGRAHLGQVDAPLLAAVRAAGMTCALTTACQTIDPRSEPFGWGRFNVYDWDTPATLAAKAAGYYGWAPALAERLCGPRGRAPARESRLSSASDVAAEAVPPGVAANSTARKWS